jgi:hypothetical protein
MNCRHVLQRKMSESDYSSNLFGPRVAESHPRVLQLVRVGQIEYLQVDHGKLVLEFVLHTRPRLWQRQPQISVQDKVST